jgi:hypothetical protein
VTSILFGANRPRWHGADPRTAATQFSSQEILNRATALGIGVADRVLMMENAYYSVISPEGCAAILWKEPTRAPDAATALKLTGPDLMELGVIDGVVPEPLGGAHRDFNAAAESLRKTVNAALEELKKNDQFYYAILNANSKLSQKILWENALALNINFHGNTELEAAIKSLIAMPEVEKENAEENI